MLQLRFLSSVAAVMLVCVTSAKGNPNHQNPDAALAVHGGEVSERLRAQAELLSTTASKSIAEFVTAAQQNKLASVKVQAVGQAHVQLLQLQRLAIQLRVLGEPAGADFELRMTRLRELLDRVLSAYTQLPQHGQIVAAAQSALQQKDPLRTRELRKIELLAGQKKWEAAEAALYAMYDENMAISVFDERTTIYLGFNTVHNAIAAEMNPMRDRNAQDALTTARDQRRPNYDDLLRDIAAATDGIRSGGRADESGQRLSGPEALRAFGERWQQLHLTALRCRAVEWARASALNVLSLPREPSIAKELEAEYAAFSQKITPALVSLIDADAARATEAEVAALYTDYLRSLAPLVARSQGSGLSSAAETALQNLAAKSPAFAAHVVAYRSSTDELLRWRRRTAEAFANSRMADYPPVDKQLVAATRGDENFRGLFPADLTTPAPALIGSAAEVMPRATQRLLGKKASVLDLAGLPGNKFAIGAYRGHTYASIAMPQPFTSQIAALKSDLMVNDQMPPLSMAAAAAVDSAERGDLAAAGGNISGIHLETVLTRFATLPASASSLVPLGTLPREPDDQEKLSLVVMRFEFQPLWTQHSYFFIKFPESVAASAE